FRVRTSMSVTTVWALPRLGHHIVDVLWKSVLETEDLGADDLLVDVEETVHLLDDVRLRGDLDDRVVGLRLLVDVVGETATTPDVGVVHRATTLGDVLEVLLDDAGNLSLINV